MEIRRIGFQDVRRIPFRVHRNEQHLHPGGDGRARGASDGSAGLGLFEVARKSDRPMEYNFSPLEDGNVFFELKIYVKVED